MDIKHFRKNRIKIIKFVQKEKYKDYNLNYYLILLFIFKLYSLKRKLFMFINKFI